MVEDTELNVCSECAKFGKILKETRAVKPEEKKKKEEKNIPLPEEETIHVIRGDYAGIIRGAREKLGLNQEEFARKINEKKALLHKIETGDFKPSLVLARKLEKALNIRLIEEHKLEHEKTEKTRTEGFTIGDFINIKKL